MVTINGKKVFLDKEIHLHTFLLDQNFDPDLVVVEVDQILVKKKNFKDFLVKDSMIIEVFAFIGGG